MKYSSYSLMKSTILPVSFTLYDGENGIYRAAHQAPGRTLPFAILLYSHDSCCNITVDRQTFQVRPGEGIILPHNVKHDFCMPQAGHITWIHIFITASGIPLMDLYEAPALWKGEDAAQLLRCLHSINTCFKDPDDNVYHALRNTIRTQQAVMEICELLFNRCRPITESLPFGIDSGFFKLLSHINSHLDEQYSLQKLLDISGLSAQTIRKMFWDHFKQTPLDYVIKRKLLAACRLFTQEGASIGLAAKAVGYSDQMYFSKQFKKHMGCTPSQYRKASNAEY